MYLTSRQGRQLTARVLYHEQVCGATHVAKLALPKSTTVKLAKGKGHLYPADIWKMPTTGRVHPSVSASRGTVLPCDFCPRYSTQYGAHTAYLSDISNSTFLYGAVLPVSPVVDWHALESIFAHCFLQQCTAYQLMIKKFLQRDNSSTNTKHAESSRNPPKYPLLAAMLHRR